MANDTASQLPRNGGYPQLQGRDKTPSYNRPETSASPTWASAAVTITFHALPSVDLTICWTLPESANLPPDSSPPLSVLLDRSTSLRNIHYGLLARPPKRSLHTPTQQKCTINTLYSNIYRNYINPRNTLVYLNTKTRRLYHIN